MENTLRVMTPEETKVKRTNSGLFFPRNKRNKRNEGKVNDKSSLSSFTIWNESNRLILVHAEISVTKVTNGKYIESHDSRRNKGNEKKIWAIFSPVTNVTKANQLLSPLSADLGLTNYLLDVVVLFHLLATTDKIYGNHFAPWSVESLIKYAFT